MLNYVILFEYLQRDEFSELPLRTFRVISNEQPGLYSHLTNEANTELGALRTFANFGWEGNGSDCQWDYYCYMYMTSPDMPESSGGLKKFEKKLISENVISQGSPHTT